MSAEVIAIVISAAALLATFVTMFIGGFAWVIRRMDERFTGVDEKLGARITAVERELVEVKIGIARLEGPPRQLLAAR